MTLYKIDNKQRLTIAQGTLFNTVITYIYCLHINILNQHAVEHVVECVECVEHDLC